MLVRSTPLALLALALLTPAFAATVAAAPVAPEACTEDALDVCAHAGLAASSPVFCTYRKPGCEHSLACEFVTEPDVCVPVPCDRTQCLRAEPRPIEECVWIVPEGGDMGERVCVDTDGPCYAFYERTTFLGTWRVCLLPPGMEGPGVPDSTAASSPPPCADRYWETGVGPVRVVSRSTCEYEVCIHDRCHDLLQ